MARRKTTHEQVSVQPTEAVMPLDYETLVTAIAQVHSQTQWQAVQAVNMALTLRNWLIGYHIVEYEQHGSDRARYGERLLDTLARDLRRKIGRGFTKRYLELFRQFYGCYPIAKSLISQFSINLPSLPSVPFTPLDWQDDGYFARLFQELPWTHFIELIRYVFEFLGLQREALYTDYPWPGVTGCQGSRITGSGTPLFPSPRALSTRGRHATASISLAGLMAVLSQPGAVPDGSRAWGRLLSSRSAVARPVVLRGSSLYAQVHLPLSRRVSPCPSAFGGRSYP